MSGNKKQKKKAVSRKEKRGDRNGTPVRSLFVQESPLRSLVEDGLGAVETAHRKLMNTDFRTAIEDSLDIDAALRPGRDQENRWDYLLGHSATGKVIAVEPHSAKQDQIKKIIDKKEAALDQMRNHLQPTVHIVSWIWVASSNVQFANTDKARLRLAQKGIEFAGKQLTFKHLPK